MSKPSSSQILDSLAWPPIRVMLPILASLSFVASSIMASMIILPSNGGLSKPYRRIVFSIGVSDMLQSLALIMGPWMLPVSSNEYDKTWGVGNESTCRMNGFMLTIGSQSMCLYIGLLCTYYLCNQKYRMTDDQFYYKIERKSHVFIVIYVLMIASTHLLFNTFHPYPQANNCLNSNTPRGCEFVPDLVGECDERVKFYNSLLTYITSAVPLGSFTTIFVCMWLLVVHTLRMTNNNANTNSEEEENNIESQSQLQSSESQSQEKKEENLDESSPTQLSDTNPAPTITSHGGLFYVTNSSTDSKNNEQESNLSDRVQTRASSSASRRDREEFLSQLYRNEAILQAALYIGVFCYTYGSAAIIVLVFNMRAIVVPFSLQIMCSFSFPLGGVLNMLVYARPKISYLRQLHPECSWWKGLFLVFRVGGEVPDSLDYDTCCLNCFTKPRPAYMVDRPMVRYQENIQQAVSQLSRDQPDVRQHPAVVSSNIVMNGMSESFGESYARLRTQKEHWGHLQGTNSLRKCVSLARSNDDSNKSRESIKGRIIAIEPSVNDPVPMKLVSDLTIDARVAG
uniref:G-protein coupled receptors family 1 profile domain-containing protein n=1 Tax=Chaetoceros debilis TaxID=122233 RepID=A0A7S3Q347_9STRA